MDAAYLLDQTTLTRLQAALRWIDEQRGSHPAGGEDYLSFDGDSGAIPITNDTDGDLQEGGVYRLTGMADDGQTFTVDFSEGLGGETLVIAAGAVAYESEGMAYIAGTAAHKILVDDASGLSVGDRLGGKEDAHEARETGLGPFEVLGVLADDGLAWVRFVAMDFPPLYQATADAASSSVSAQQVTAAWAKTGDTETFAVDTS